MKILTPLDSISFWARGPWWFLNMGLNFVQLWQDECYSRLRLLPGAALVPVAKRPPLLAARTIQGDEIAELNAAIAARQGREMPALGCLQGVKVVGGPATDAVAERKVAPPVKPVAAKAAVKPAPKAASKPAVQPVEVSQPAVAAAVVEAVAVVPEAIAPAAAVPEAVAEVVPEPVAASDGSVTSMLAMQAKLLAKAVKRGDNEPVAATKAAKTARSAAKPVAATMAAPAKTGKATPARKAKAVPSKEA